MVPEAGLAGHPLGSHIDSARSIMKIISFATIVFFSLVYNPHCSVKIPGTIY
jgi:hypothetical protein